MTTDRCPGCGAAVTPGAPWCTLCYTDLRAPAPQQAAMASAAVSTVPTPAVQPQPLPPDPILDAPVAVASPVVGNAFAFWPCAGCGSRVPIADDACSKCGASFLPSDSTLSLSLPGVGNVARLDKPQRVGLVIGGIIALTAVFMLLAFLLGSIL